MGWSSYTMPQGVVDSTIWEGDGRAAGWDGCFEIVLACSRTSREGPSRRWGATSEIITVDNSTDSTIDFATIISLTDKYIYIYIDIYIYIRHIRLLWCVDDAFYNDIPQLRPTERNIFLWNQSSSRGLCLSWSWWCDPQLVDPFLSSRDVSHIHYIYICSIQKDANNIIRGSSLFILFI